MHRNAEKFDWKTQSKIACDYTWLLDCKPCLYWWCFVGILLSFNQSSTVEGQTLQPKDIKKGEEGKVPKKLKNRKPICRSQNFDFCASPSKNIVNMVLVERKEGYRVPLKTVVQAVKSLYFWNISARDCFSFLPCLLWLLPLNIFKLKLLVNTSFVAKFSHAWKVLTLFLPSASVLAKNCF